MRPEAARALLELVEVVETLRAPGGCPWDREQTHESLRPYLLEETYEALEAIDLGQPETLREELGDVLLQVLMHSVIAGESVGGFDIGEVAEVTRAKMVSRHPHVFGDASVEGAAEVLSNWERLKSLEKHERLSLLEGVPRTLPALARAQGLQKRPARLGFDETPGIAAAVAQLRSVLADLERVALGEPADVEQGPGEDAEAIVGDVLYAVVAVARHLHVSAEDALRSRSERFAERFAILEARARKDHVDLHGLDGSGWATRWAATAD